MKNISLSIVSHGQAGLVNSLLNDIVSHCPSIDLLLTCNIPETQTIQTKGLPGVHLFDNSSPQGFAANHNAAFRHCQSPFFCVANPDIRLHSDPFPELISCFQDPDVGVVSPQICAPDGDSEDSARYFPTPAGLVGKLLKLGQGRYPVAGNAPVAVDWLAGMFMVFRAEAFREIGGFDERFFLYYEDVDICARLWNAGWKVMLQPRVQVTHAAQRASRRNFRHMKWHLASMTRYFGKHLGRTPRGWLNL